LDLIKVKLSFTRYYLNWVYIAQTNIGQAAFRPNTAGKTCSH